MIAFINVDLEEHGSVGSAWDSGILATGTGYKVKLNSAGTFTYGDSTDASVTGQITVTDAPVIENAIKVFLPLVSDDSVLGRRFSSAL